MKLPTDTTVFQNAWVVDDLESSMNSWIETFNIGPFFVLDHSEDIVDVMYRGQPGKLTMKLALAQAGPVQIELVEPKGDAQCCYRDTVKKGETGFHHVCTWTHDIDADLAYYEKQGCVAANTGRVKDSIRFAYIDTHKELNCMIELMECNAVVEEVFKLIADAGNDWDGSDPIRYI